MSTVRRWFGLTAAVLVFLVPLMLLEAPVPFLFAGLLGAMVIALTTSDPPTPHPAGFRAAQAIIGVSVAVQIDPAALREVGGDLLPLLAIILATIVVSVAVGQLLRLHGVSAVTATFSSIAGGASGMIALADEYRADSRIVLINQYLRVLFILLTLPVVITLVFSSDAGEPRSQALWAGSGADYAFVAIALVAGVVLGRLAHLPAPALLGPMAVGMGVAQIQIFEAAVVPGWVQALGFGVLGAQVGLRFTQESLRATMRMMPTILVVLVVSVALCAGFGVLLAALTGESQLDAYLATTPGGLPAVLAASTSTSGNVTFVTAAQTIRLLLVLLVTPLLARWWFRRSAD